MSRELKRFNSDHPKVLLEIIKSHESESVLKPRRFGNANFLLILKLLRTYVCDAEFIACLFRTLIHMSCTMSIDNSAESQASIRRCFETPGILEAMVNAFEQCMNNTHVIKLFIFFVHEYLYTSSQKCVRYDVLNSRLVVVLIKCVERHRQTINIESFRYNSSGILFMSLLHHDIHSCLIDDVYQCLMATLRLGQLNDKRDSSVCLAILLSAKDSPTRCDHLIDSGVLSELFQVLQKENDEVNLVGLPAALAVIITCSSLDRIERVFKEVEKGLVSCVDSRPLMRTEHALVALNALYLRCSFEHHGFILDSRKLSLLVVSFEYISFLCCQLIEKRLNACVRHLGTHEVVQILDLATRTYPNNCQLSLVMTKITSKLCSLDPACRRTCASLKGIVSSVRRLLSDNIWDCEICVWTCSVIGHLASNLNVVEKRCCFIAVVEAFNLHSHDQAAEHILCACMKLAKHNRRFFRFSRDAGHYKLQQRLSSYVDNAIRTEKDEDKLSRLRNMAKFLSKYKMPFFNKLHKLHLETRKLIFM